MTLQVQKNGKRAAGALFLCNRWLFCLITKSFTQSCRNRTGMLRGFAVINRNFYRIFGLPTTSAISCLILSQQVVIPMLVWFSRQKGVVKTHNQNLLLSSSFFFWYYLLSTLKMEKNDYIVSYDTTKVRGIFALHLPQISFVPFVTANALAAIERKLFIKLNFLFFTYAMLYKKIQVLFSFSKVTPDMLATSLVNFTSASWKLMLEHTLKIRFVNKTVYKPLNVGDAIKYCIFFIRKTKSFNKSRYSRNRQLYRTGVYWCLWLNIILVYGLYFFFYRFTFNFGFLWLGLCVLSFAFVLPRSIQYKLYSPRLVVLEIIHFFKFGQIFGQIFISWIKKNNQVIKAKMAHFVYASNALNTLGLLSSFMYPTIFFAKGGVSEFVFLWCTFETIKWSYKRLFTRQFWLAIISSLLLV